MKKGRNRLKIIFRFPTDGNKFKNNEEIKTKSYKKFIPASLFSRKGFVRGLDTDLDEKRVTESVTKLTDCTKCLM